MGSEVSAATVAAAANEKKTGGLKSQNAYLDFRNELVVMRVGLKGGRGRDRVGRSLVARCGKDTREYELGNCPCRRSRHESPHVLRRQS
jgi:hypothetical protein